MEKVIRCPRAARWLRGLLLPALMVVGTVGFSQSAATDGPLRILFVGNSLTYWNVLPAQLAAMADSLSITPPLEYEMAVSGGVDLDWHLNSQETMRKIRQGGWRFVVLQEYETGLKDFKKSLAAAAALTKEARLVGAEVVLFETWGWGDDNLNYVQPTSREWCGSDYFEMQAKLLEAYAKTATAVRVRVVPVGDAWELVKRSHPEIELHSGDSVHPTVCGTYLSALVFLGVLTGRDPRELGWLPESGVSADTAALLRTAAWETISQN